MRKALIQYILRCNHINCQRDQKTVTTIQQLVEQSAKLSCYTITQLVNKILEYAFFNNHFPSIEQSDVISAKKELGLKLEKITTTQNRTDSSSSECIIA